MTQKVCLTMDDRYVTGRGMMGGPKESVGKYNVGPAVTNLSRGQFNTQANIEEAQERRLRRKRESGVTGRGSWYDNYPWFIGTMGTGSAALEPANPNPSLDGDSGATASDAAGNMGEIGRAHV